MNYIHQDHLKQSQKKKYKTLQSQELLPGQNELKIYFKKNLTLFAQGQENCVTTMSRRKKSHKNLNVPEE